MELKQTYICDKCGSREINVRMIPDIETNVPMPAPLDQAKCSASKYNYKSYCLKAMKLMKSGESLLIKDRSEATVRGWFNRLALDMIREERKNNKNSHVIDSLGQPRNLNHPLSARWKYKNLLKDNYRIEKVAHFEHRIWKIK